jgi:uncharacterized protein DUF6602
MTAKVVMDWFDRLEAVLEAESQLSGLLDHSPTVGQAREFVVARVLKTILPAGVHIGSGMVIDRQGNSSKQIDVVIYDPRFPMMKLDGGGLYFVEGVLATIEIKSTIDTSELKGSLENCRSVLALWPHGEHPHEAEARIRFYADKGNLTRDEAEHRFWYMFRPATYIFAFRSKLSLDTTCSAIVEWWRDEAGCKLSSHFPLLPRVLTAGNVVGLVNDGRISLNTLEGNRQVMTLFKTEKRFRWLAIHLMDAVSQRLGLRNFGEQFDYRLSDYYPFDAYLAEIDQAAVKTINWSVPALPA